jgi:hypothetical protein
LEKLWTRKTEERMIEGPNSEILWGGISVSRESLGTAVRIRIIEGQSASYESIYVQLILQRVSPVRYFLWSSSISGKVLT